jgi:hypothetical protein
MLRGGLRSVVSLGKHRDIRAASRRHGVRFHACDLLQRVDRVEPPALRHQTQGCPIVLGDRRLLSGVGGGVGRRMNTLDITPGADLRHELAPAEAVVTVDGLADDRDRRERRRTFRQRLQRPSPQVTWSRRLHEVENRGHDVDQLDDILDAAARADAGGRFHDQRDVNLFRADEQAVFLLAVLAEAFAVIGDEQDRRLVVELVRLEVADECSAAPPWGVARARRRPAAPDVVQVGRGKAASCSGRRASVRRLRQTSSRCGAAARPAGRRRRDRSVTAVEEIKAACQTRRPSDERG